MSEQLEQGGAIENVEPVSTQTPDSALENGEPTPTSPVSDQTQNGQLDGDGGEPSQEPAGTDRLSDFKNLMNKEYKDESTKVFTELLNNRFKKHDKEVSTLREQVEGIENVFSAFGVSTMEELMEKSRAELAKQKAYDQGIPEEVALAHEAELERLRRENLEFKKKETSSQAEQLLTEFEKGIIELSDELGLSALELLSDDKLVDEARNGKTVKAAYYGLYPDKVDASRKSSATEQSPPQRVQENIASTKKPPSSTPQPTAGQVMQWMALAKKTGKKIDFKTGAFLD